MEFVFRLCEPIEGTSAAQLSLQLGLDASKYQRSSAQDEADPDYGFVPTCMLDDAERFKDCKRLMCKCFSCNLTSPFPGVIDLEHSRCGLFCPACGEYGWGLNSEYSCYGYVFNQVTLLMRECLQKYYDNVLVCDDPTCGLRSRQQSVIKNMCSGCRGVVFQEYTEAQLHNQIKYLESLFDVDRKVSSNTSLEEKCEFVFFYYTTIDEFLLAFFRVMRENLIKGIPKKMLLVLTTLRDHIAHVVNGNAYNWIRPSLWTALFGKV